MHPLAKLIVAVRALAVLVLATVLIAWVVGPRLNHASADRPHGATARAAR